MTVKAYDRAYAIMLQSHTLPPHNLMPCEATFAFPPFYWHCCPFHLLRLTPKNG